MSQTSKVLVLNADEVNELLSFSECIELMTHALRDLSQGKFVLPLRTIVRPQDAKGVMGLMPAYRTRPETVYGLKAICFFYENAALGLDAHQGCVLLHSGDTGELLAIINASAITTIRTAAVSAVATRLLSREESTTLAIVGSGVQARAHLKALSCVRSLELARIASRNPDHAVQLVEEMKNSIPFTLEALTTVEEAVLGADIIVTATTSRTPVINRKWISDGTHINAVGTYSPESREIDSETMRDARLYVDRRESAVNEAGDYLIPRAEGLIGPDSIVGEIGEVILGDKPGRTSTTEITLFESLGLAIEDLACAEYLFAKAKAQSVGTWIRF
jgi:ornithine cyclodeaminase